MRLAQLSAGFQSPLPLPTSILGPSGADSWVGGFVYVLGPCGSVQQTLLGGWEFLMPLPPPQVFSVRGFEALFPPHWNPTLRGLSHSPVVPPDLSTHKYWSGHFASCHLATSPEILYSQMSMQYKQNVK